MCKAASSAEDEMSIFPTKILLATDGSEDAELATTTVAALTKSTGSSCTSSMSGSSHRRS